MELALGTVQFGLNYGVANTGGKVSDAQTRAILSRAWEGGVRRLDTAAAYGDIEERLCELCGELPFDIVSKIPSISGDMTEAAAIEFATASATRSIERLGPRLNGILFHDAENLAGLRGVRIWNAVSDALHGSGVQLGSSGYDPGSMAALLSAPEFTPAFDPTFKMAQLPGNALDQRFLAHAAQFTGVEITIRSALLQGLLVMNADQAVRRVPAAVGAIRQWHAFCAKRGLGALEAAFSIVKGFDAAAYCVIGVDNLDQLEANLAEWSRAVAIAAPVLTSADTAVIDPRLWPALGST